MTTDNEASNLAAKIDKYIIKLENRTPDWGALDFQTQVSPKYRRAQIRYLGGGGTGMHDDPNILPAEHFTLSTMLLPAGCEGPLHKHHDVEEVFFVIQGQVTVIWEEDGVEVERVIGVRDLCFTPPGMYRGLRNDTAEDALMLVMLGASRPQLPTYPEGSPMDIASKNRRKNNPAQ